MRTPKFVLTFASAALLVAGPAMGQVLNHPVHSVPQGDGGTFFGAQYGRGLNDDSGKANSFMLAGGMAGERISFSIGAGLALDVPAPDNNEFSLAGNVGVHLLSDDSTPVQLTGQVGFGWASLSQAAPANDATYTSFPIGVAISGRPSDSGTSVRPWIMPRLDIVRMSDDLVTATETNFGASAGVGITTEGGAGAHVAADWVAGGDLNNPFGIGIGVHYVIR